MGDTGADLLWGIGSRFPSITKGTIAERQDDGDAWKPRQADQLVAKRRRAEDADDEAEPIGVVTDLSLAQVGKLLAKALRLTITDQGDRNHGYRTLHGRAKSGAQIWISPNQVPRGFVRKGEKDYATLVKRGRGTALRFPEHPDVAYVLELADLDADDVTASCARAGLTVQPLVTVR